MMKLNASWMGLFAIAALAGSSASAGVNPSSVKIRIYGVAVSTSTDCSNAKVISYNAAGTEYDFLANPAIANGTIDAGTYACVILYMSSNISFVPATSSGGCTAGTTYQQVLCNQGNGCTYTDAAPDSSNVLQFGSDLSATATNHSDTANANKVLLFLSTGSTNDGSAGGTFLRPTASTMANHGLALTSPLVVSSSGGSGTFVVNFAGKVMGDGSAGPACGVDAPVLGFR